MYVRSRYSSFDFRKASMTVDAAKNTPVNTLYGPDDKPMLYMYEIEPIEFGFQPQGKTATGDAAPLERV